MRRDERRGRGRDLMMMRDRGISMMHELTWGGGEEGGSHRGVRDISAGASLLGTNMPHVVPEFPSTRC